MNLLAFVRLVRPINLLIIIVTLYTMRFCFILPSAKSGSFEAVSGGDFALLTLIMVLMAAAGNIINDYFDVRVDKINKPERVIIDHGVKRRVAMGAHHVINVLAVGICGYLCWKHGFFWPLAIPVVIITALWFYSMSLQKTFFLGNVTVAFLIAIVPLWSGIFDLGKQGFGESAWIPLFLFAGLAWLVTIVREIIKDIQDKKGDASQGFRTLPIVWGISKTKRFASGWAGLLFIILVNMAFRINHLLPETAQYKWLVLPNYILLLILPSFLLLIGIIRSKSSADFARLSTLSKMLMLFALIFTVLWRFLFLDI